MKKVFLFVAAMMTAAVMNLQAEQGSGDDLPVAPTIVGMYDKWNIVLNKNAFELALSLKGVEADIDPENVTWYKVNGDPDEVDPISGKITDDKPAIPFTGLFHTEATTMDGQYYAVVYVPEAMAVMGQVVFRSNVVFMDAKRMMKRASDVSEQVEETTSKKMVDGRVVIVKDGVEYNAMGIQL